MEVTMAQASPSLSPKALERIRRHRTAVAVLARHRGKENGASANTCPRRQGPVLLGS